MTHLSVVVPLYNESSLIGELVSRVKNSLESVTEDFEIILVDDGSLDKTWELIEIEAEKEKRLKGIKFSRNFGHHYAITAGLHNSSGEWVIVMDGDLQDRPEVIPDLYNKAVSGFDIVFVSRQKRPEKIYYLVIQKFFYWGLKRLSGIDFDSSQANFSIINKKVVEAYKRFPENARFYGSTIKWLGFSSGNIFADHGTRHSGKPSYTLKKRINLASDIIFSFSDRPLKFSVYFGILISFQAILGAVWILFQSLRWGYEVSGWPSLIISIVFFSGIIISILGIIGIYVGRVYREVKNRPLYVLDRTINFTSS
jgi:glycosyltransferase involved in cell wall biosynthesis